MDETLNKLKITKESYTSTPLHRGRIWFFLVVTALLLTVGAAYLFKHRGVEVETAVVTTIYPTQSFTLLNASGYLVAQRKAAVASKITGRLEWLGVEEGSRVSAGQVLARLENHDLQAALDQARANLHSAQASLDQSAAEQEDAARAYTRQRELLAQGIVPQAEFELAEVRHRRAQAGMQGGQASVRSAAAALRGAEVTYDYSLIRAPFNGVVLTKNADVGDIITPIGAAATAKAAVVTIADPLSLQVEADVAESNLAQVRPGQPCEVTLDALPGVRLSAVVHTIVPTADRSKASVMVKVRFLMPDRRLLPEMSAKVAFLSRPATDRDQQPHTALPLAAVKTEQGHTTVLVVTDGVARKRLVTLGPRLGDLVEVQGVKPGERLVLRPLDKVRDGSRVMVKEP